jgi:hypothetical protein
MSRIPSNTDQFLQGVALGTQNLGLASQNQRAKMDYSLAQQQMGLERQRMAQQGQQFQQGLAAETANAEMMQQGRERMQQRELAQQGTQFDQTMQFNREQNQIERMISMRMKQIDMDLMRNEQETAAMADNDPRLQAARAKRLQLKRQGYELQELMASTQAGLGMAQGVRNDRLQEAEATVSQYQEAVNQRAAMARDAVRSGFDYAVTKDALEGGFLNEAQRYNEAIDLEIAKAQSTGDFSTLMQYMTGQKTFTTGTAHYGMMVMLDNVKAYFTGQGSPELAAKRASDFIKNGGAMASQVLDNAIRLNESAFGLEGPEKDAAARAVSEIVSYATIMTGLEPRFRGTGNTAELRQKIAQNVGKLRQYGMGDEQISALFEGLEDLGAQRPQLLAQYQERDPDVNQAKLLETSLDGVSRIQDMIEGVLSDDKLMKPVGGRLADISKFNMVNAIKKAQLAYGTTQDSAQMMGLMEELQGLGMGRQEIEAVASRLIEADPNLKFLRPEEYANFLEALGRRGTNIGLEAETTAEDIGQLQGQVVAEGRLRGLSEAEQRLADLAGLIGG